MATIKIPAGAVIQDAINAAPPGSTFQLGKGTHRMQSITLRTGDRLDGVIKGSKLVSILSGARVLSSWQFEGRVWFIDNQTHGELATGQCDPQHPRCLYPEDLFIDDDMKLHVETREEVRPGTWFFDYPANRIYIGDNPRGKRVELSAQPAVLTEGSQAASDVLITDLIIEKYATPNSYGAVRLGGSHLGAARWELARCELRWCHGGAVWNDSDTQTRECYVHHCGGLALVGAGANIVIEGNEIAHNNTIGSNQFWDGGGSKWVWTTRLIVRGNYAHHNKGPALWTDINNIYTLYEDNVVEQNTRCGIFHEIGYDAIIRRNRLRFNGTGKDYPHWTTGAGIEVVGSRNVEVYENDLDGNWQGITGLMDYRHDPNAPHGAWELVNFHVHDNRVISTQGWPAQGGGRTGITEVGGTGVGDPVKRNRFERNHYVLSDRNEAAFFWVGIGMRWPVWQDAGQDLDGTLETV